MIAHRINRWLAGTWLRFEELLSGWLGVVLLVASVAFLIACAVWWD